MDKTTRTITGAALALAVGATLAAPASARPRPEPHDTSAGAQRISISGTCDAGSQWTLSGRSRFLRIVVEGRVDAAPQRKKSRWFLRLEQNQSAVAVRLKRSSGGRVKVKARVANQPGPDIFTLTAANSHTGETCQGTLTF